MKYKYIVDYTPTDPAGEASQRECSPTYGDDLAVTVAMESDEWYRKRKLDGKLTFGREDYAWIMSRAFDGTFKLTVQGSTDGGATWRPYLEGTFSRANLEIDEDNQNCILNGLNEGGEYNAIENGKSEEYDLMKIIPDSEAKEVQGEVHPALALVDYNTTDIEHSDIFCDAAITAAGYDSKHPKSGFSESERVVSDSSWSYSGIKAEAKVEMVDGSSELNGLYGGSLGYLSRFSDRTFPVGLLNAVNGCRIEISLDSERRDEPPFTYSYYKDVKLIDANDNERLVSHTIIGNTKQSPQSEVFDFSESPFYGIKKIEILYHYIRATLLTQAGGNADNVLDTGDYYKRMAAFNNDGGLIIAASANTVEQPNGHRLVPGTGEQGTAPQYFAPPDETEHWIPLAEYGWQYGSLWYRITPSVANGLLDPSKVGSFRWTRCWTLGTCLDRLLKKITNNKVTFDQSEAGSQFLYSAVNPLTQGEPFEYLFTQKSNVMRPSVGGESAARCIVRLEWFLEFLRNGLNCYWWLEERNGGTYAFRVEHVEWFRRGGSYTGQMDAQFNLTEIKTRRNFPRNGEAAKRLDDQLHKYSYDMNGMTEKYLFSWQGDGGSDDFKGNPMFFKAGWVERGTSESHEVDNIFADLAWLMLNAGSDTASSKNHEGIFVFSGYKAYDITQWDENKPPLAQYLNNRSFANLSAWVTIMPGYTADYEKYNTLTGDIEIVDTYYGTGKPQLIQMVFTQGQPNIVPRINFGLRYDQQIIHRIHFDMPCNIFNVPNMENLLSGGYLQNGVLAWPWLQCEFLHYDVPAQRWSYDSDDIDTATFEATGTVKMRKKQEVPMLSLPTKSDEEKLDKGVIGGLRDSQGQLQTGIVISATINLGTRNATLTLMYDMIS